MMLGSWIVALAGPIAARVLVSLGLGIATYAITTSGYHLLRSYLDLYIQGIPGSALSILALAGVDTAMGLILGAIAARITYLSAARVARLYSV